jgi:hypothetical protein
MGDKSKARISFLIIFLCCFLVSVFSCLVLTSSPAHAVDELNLTGIVQSVDLKSGIAVVDVKSESCKGMRRFRTDDPADLKELEGIKVSFLISSSACKAGEIYKITNVAPVPEVRTR